MKSIFAYSIGVVFILLVMLVPMTFLKPFKDLVFQLGLAILIVGLVVYDPFLGLLVGVGAIIGYARVHAAFLGPIVKMLPGSTELITPYVTAQNLKDAQNNIVSDKEYEQPIKGIRGVYGEPVYSAQGTEKNKDILPGRTKEMGSPIEN
jgi:hypothetical protein